MADGTVRGAFDLDVSRAVRGVRDYRREAARADVQTRQLGTTMDRAFGEDVPQRIQRVSRSTNDLADETRKTRLEVRSHWQGMRRDIERESAQIVSSIAVVRDRVRALGRERATVRIDVAGIAHAIAQVEVLHARLAALGASRTTARVGVGGGFTGGGGGGVGRGFRGGAGRGIVRSLGAGPLALGGRALPVLAGVGLPALQALGGAATAVAGSLTGATLGAGAIGLAGGGALAAGLGSVIAVAGPANKALDEARKAQEAYTEAVREHGRFSDEAAAAAKTLDRSFRDQPGLRRATREMRAFGREWKGLTREGRQQWFGLLGDAALVGRRAAPNMAANANRATGAVRRSGVRQARFLAGAEAQSTLTALTGGFVRDLPVAERTLENIELTMMRIARVSLPFFHEGMQWLERWTFGWRTWASDSTRVERSIDKQVRSLKDWMHLGGAAFRLIRDLFRVGQSPGDSAVESLTKTFDRWDAWVKTNPEKTRRFFEESVTSVSKMASGLASVVGWLNQMATLLRPLLDRFSELVRLVSSLGLVGAPGILAAGMGAARGLRGGGGGGMGGGLGTGLALGMAGAGARRGAVARRVPISGPGFARYAGPELLGTKRYGLSRVLGAGGALRGAARGYLPIGAALSALDFAGFQGDLGQRTQAAASSFSLGLIHRPRTGSEVNDAGTQRARNYLGDLSSDPSKALGAVTRRYRELNRRFLPENVGSVGTSEGREMIAEMKELTRAYRDLREQAVALRRARNAELDERSRERALQYGSRLGTAYRVARRGGMGRQAAATATTGLAAHRLGHIRGAGVETLGESALQWAHDLERAHPEIEGQVAAIERSVRRRFERMGRGVAIVNGNILTGTRTEWRAIAAAMIDPMEEMAQRTHAAFTAMQREAVGSLKAMGFTSSEAAALVQGRETGGNAAVDANRKIDAMGKTGGVLGTKGYQIAKRARGGTIPGRGLTDSVAMGGAMVAPGETWIANRHTLGDLSRATVAYYGLTAPQIISGEHRRHSAPVGGPADSAAHVRGGGSLMGAKPGLGRYAREAALYGLRVSSGLRPGAITHAGNRSYHASGDAIDLAGAPDSMMRFAHHAARSWGQQLEELIYSPMGWSIKNGQRVAPYAVADHYDHVHLADVMGRGAVGGLADSGGGGGRSIRVRAPKVRGTGIPAALQRRVGGVLAGALEATVNSAIGGGGGGLDGFSGGGDPKSNLALGRRMMLAAGFGPDQWPALRALWHGESGWSNTARNPSSGAFGIPQCVDLETQILTKRGWLRHDEVRVGDETIGYNPETGCSEWTRVKAVLHPGRHQLWRVGVARWGARCTANHRWLMERMVNDRAVGMELVELQDQRGRGHRIVLARPAETGAGLPITLEEAALLAWIAGDGWREEARVKPRRTSQRGRLMHHRPMTYFVSQSKRENWPRIAAAVGMRGRVTRTRDGHREWRLSPPHARSLRERAGDPKDDAVAIVLAMSAEQRAVWLDAMIRAEGYVAPAGGLTQLSQAEGPVAEAIKIAVYLSGRRPSVYRHDRTAEPGRQSVELTIGVTAPEIGLRCAVIAPDGEEEVWCVETALGSWTAQQGNDVFLTGNSLPASKMGPKAVAGDAAAQIAWGLDYIRGRYGTPAGALSAWQARSPHWYARGGHMRYAGAFDRGGSFVTSGPTAFVAGEGPHNRRERVTVTPAGGSGHGQVTIGDVHVHVTVAGGLKGGGDVDSLAHEVGEKVARKIIDAIDKGQTAGVVG